jgi:hypothetical protein
MPTYTLTYDDGVKGFPSFYTYYPDWIQGMNNYLYTFIFIDITQMKLGTIIMEKIFLLY